jgi:trehalose/maltose hydrolase-like predicted phosphorylase
MHSRLWALTEYPFEPEQQHYYETIFAIGNGYLGQRASFEEGHAGETPATLVHGVFNHAPAMAVPELVNAPDVIPIDLTIDGTPFRMIMHSPDYLNPPEGVVLGYRRTLFMKSALLRREVLFRARSGSTVRFVFERFASLDDVHVIAQRLEIIAVDGAPEITIAAGINSDVTNDGVQHWADIRTTADENETAVIAVTSQSGYSMGAASRLRSPQEVTATQTGGRPRVATTIKLEPRGSATVEKFSAIYTSRDVDDPLEAARNKAHAAGETGYDALFTAHCARWNAYWADSDILIEGDDQAQLAIRFATYHLLIAAPQHDDDVSIGAKTLSGLGYKGHVFWDTELFILPPLTLAQPALARNLLMYRYHRLEGARKKARENNCEGALYPWESTDTGEETTPQWSDPQLDGTRIRIWTGDSEQHIASDIAYAVLQYWRWTGDDDFICTYGAEMVLDTAVFWGSRVEDRNGRYEISRQIGPDEYHENIDNSYFTNRLVVWHLEQALALLEWLRINAPADAERLTDQLDLTPSRLAHWQDIIERMYLPFDEEKQRHIQFDGFFHMEYVPVPDYEPRVGGVWHMLGHERILNSQVLKQADIIMLMALLGDEVGPREVLMNNWNTYYPRTDHASSLSPAIHAWVAARLGLDDIAYEMFDHAGSIDLKDNKGNVRDGIHGAACGGLWQALIFGFCGLRLGEDGPEIVEPRLPAHWRRVRFHVYYRGEQRRFVVENPAQ